MQARFQALEELSVLKQLVQKCVVPGIKSWSLYTTPPKQVCIKLLSSTNALQGLYGFALVLSWS